MIRYSYHSAPVIHHAPIIQNSVVKPAIVDQTVVTPAHSSKVVQSEVAKKPKAQLVLDVPEDAKVLLLGKQMTKTGTTRSWYVPLSKFGTDYHYSVTVQLGDQSVTQEITIASNDETHLRFGVADGALIADFEAAEEVSTPATNSDKPRARLVLNVPEDAAVTLKGKAMESSGKVRVWNVPVSKPNVNYQYEIRVQVGDQTLAHTTIVRASETTNITVSEQDGKLIAETGTSRGSQLASL